MRVYIASLILCLAVPASSAVTCAYVDGVYTCQDGAPSVSTQYCETVDGQLVCSDDLEGAKSQAVGEIDGTNAATVAESSLAIQGGMFSDLMGWLQGVILWLPRWIWQSVLGALGALIKIIPAPAAFATFVQSVSGISGSVVWFLDLVEFKFGVTVVLGSLLSRWILRRIPGIG